MQLAARMRREEVPAGSAVIQRGRAGRALLRVVSGLIAVSQTALGPRRLLRPGDTFGEVALAMGVPRTASVRALVPSVVASCDRATFDELVRPLFADDDSSRRRPPSSASAASRSPIAGANLKPWPLHGEPTTIRPCRSSTKRSSGRARVEARLGGERIAVGARESAADPRRDRVHEAGSGAAVRVRVGDRAGLVRAGLQPDSGRVEGEEALAGRRRGRRSPTAASSRRRSAKYATVSRVTVTGSSMPSGARSPRAQPPAVTTTASASISSPSGRQVDALRRRTLERRHGRPLAHVGAARGRRSARARGRPRPPARSRRRAGRAAARRGRRRGRSARAPRRRSAPRTPRRARRAHRARLDVANRVHEAVEHEQPSPESRSSSRQSPYASCASATHSASG